MVGQRRDLAHVGFGEGGCKGVDLAAEGFTAEARFVHRTGAAAVQHAPHAREDAEHREGFQREQDAAAGATLDRVQNGEVALEGGFIDNKSGCGRGEHNKSKK